MKNIGRTLLQHQAQVLLLLLLLLLRQVVMAVLVRVKIAVITAPPAAAAGVRVVSLVLVPQPIHLLRHHYVKQSWIGKMRVFLGMRMVPSYSN